MDDRTQRRLIVLVIIAIIVMGLASVAGEVVEAIAGDDDVEVDDGDDD